MKNYKYRIFIDKECDPHQYIVIAADRFEDIYVSDYIDKYGERINAIDAGDSIELLSDSAVQFANSHENNEGKTPFTKGDYVYGDDYYGLFNDLADEYGHEDNADIRFHRDVIEGIQFVNKSGNIQTFNPAHYDELSTRDNSEREMIELFHNAIEDKQLQNTHIGFVYYASETLKNSWFDEYVIRVSNYQGDFEDYRIVDIDS